jgi:hypothetical protein
MMLAISANATNTKFTPKNNISDGEVQTVRKRFSIFNFVGISPNFSNENQR